MEKYNIISRNMSKHLVQQKVQQRVHNNYAALLKRRFVFTKLVECFYQELENSIEDVNFIFLPV